MPPQSKESSSQDNLDPSKRPKHVVLSDTIQLVRYLQIKVGFQALYMQLCTFNAVAETMQHIQSVSVALGSTCKPADVRVS